MPVGSTQYTNIIYYKPFEGKVERKFDNPEEGTFTREDKNGKTINVKHEDYLQGFIHKLQKEDGDYGWDLKITMREFDHYEDGQPLEVFTISLYSQLGQMFFNQLATMGVAAQEIRINMWGKRGDDKVFRSYLYINTVPQDPKDKWGSAAFKWEKDESRDHGLQGLPDLTEGISQGKKTFDSTNRVNAMVDEVMEQIEHINGSEPWLFVRNAQAENYTSSEPAQQPLPGPTKPLSQNNDFLKSDENGDNKEESEDIF